MTQRCPINYLQYAASAAPAQCVFGYGGLRRHGQRHLHDAPCLVALAHCWHGGLRQPLEPQLVGGERSKAETSYTGPTTLADFDMPLDKTPVFVGGKGIYISRISDNLPLQAVVFPIANGGSTYHFTHPDGTSTSAIINNNTGWNTVTLTVTNTTSGSPVNFTNDSTTGAIRFEILPGNNYALSGGN